MQVFFQKNPPENKEFQVDSVLERVCIIAPFTEHLEYFINEQGYREQKSDYNKFAMLFEKI